MIILTVKTLPNPKNLLLSKWSRTHVKNSMTKLAKNGQNCQSEPKTHLLSQNYRQNGQSSKTSKMSKRTKLSKIQISLVLSVSSKLKERGGKATRRKADTARGGATNQASGRACHI